MPKVALTEARVRALKSRKHSYDIRDGALRGFGVRVLPSGRKRYFVHCQHRGERIWKIVGPADLIPRLPPRPGSARPACGGRRGRARRR